MNDVDNNLAEQASPIKKDLVDKETCENEFDRWAEAMDLDLDPDNMDEDDLNAFTRQKRRILKGMACGALAVNDNGEAVFTPQNPKSKLQKSLTFHERTGGSLMAMDGKKKNYDVAKTYAILADVCRTTPRIFAGLVGSDIKLCEALFALLMD